MPAADPRPLPLAIRLFYGAGAIASGVKDAAFTTFLLFYYNAVLGLPGTWAGAAIFISLVFDAMTGPLVGSISDGLRSRWGRRHPFMYAAALPMAAGFWLLFHPPAGLGQAGLFAWMTAFSIAVRASMDLYQIPLAMLPELTHDYDERTSLVALRYLFGWFAGLSMSLLGYLVFFAPSEAHADGRLNAAAYGDFGAAGALFIAAAILACAGGTHRVIPALGGPTGHEPLGPRRFAREVAAVLRNPSYRVLLLAALFAAVARGFTEVVNLYVNTYFWELSTAQISVLASGLFVSALLAFAIARPLSARSDKRRAALGLAALIIVFMPLAIVLRLLGWFPANGHPALLPLLLAHAVLMIGAFVTVQILFSSMVADVADEHELDTGQRQEGLFVAAIAFADKATAGLGGFLAGVALDLIAFPRQAALGAVPPEKVTTLGLVVGPGSMLLYVATLVFLARYRITRERHQEVRAALAARRAAAVRLEEA